MPIEHADIPESNLHEPKGVSLASANQVYLSDGEGSGSWTFFAQNIVKNVNSMADFPSPVAGVITLGTNITYKISGALFTSDRIQFSTNSAIIGTNRFTDSLTYLGTDVFLSSTTTHKIEELGLWAPTGTMFALTGSGSETCVYTNSYVIGCVSMGTITGWRTTVFRSFSLIGASDVTSGGLTFAGSCDAFNMDNSLWQGVVAGPSIDFGSAIFDRIQILSGNRFDVESGQYALAGAANSGNLRVGGAGIIDTCIFEGAGDALQDITSTDFRWKISNNAGTEDTHKGASGYIKASAATTSTSTTPTVVNFGSNFIADEEDQFTVDTDGRVSYLGAEPHQTHVSANLFVDIGSGTNVPYYFYIAKNGTPIQSSVAEGEFDNSDPSHVSVTGSVNFSFGDYVELYVEKQSGTGTDIIRTANIVVGG